MEKLSRPYERHESVDSGSIAHFLKAKRRHIMCDRKTKRQRRACFSEQQAASDNLGKAEEKGRDVGVQTGCCHSVLTPNLLFLKTEKVLNVFRQVKAKSIPPTDSLGRDMLFLVTMGNT